MAEYQKVKSTMEISVSITDYLEMFVRQRTNGRTRGKNIREINDILQGRSKRTVDELLAEVREKSHNWYPGAVDEFIRDIAAIQAQKALLSVPYDKAGDEKYHFKIYDPDGRPLKIVDQALFDRAAQIDGFPPDFFRETYFDRVTIYCMPDDTDCSGSAFRNCTFAACRLKGGRFEDCSIYDCDFHSCLLDGVGFLRSTLAHTFFTDDTFKNVRFDNARLKFCFFRYDIMDAVSFRHTVLDSGSFAKIEARHIHGLHTATITHGGATAEEVREIRTKTFKALKVPEAKQPARGSVQGR